MNISVKIIWYLSETMETATLTERTTAIINGLSETASSDTKVLVGLIKLLLEEVSGLSSMKGLIEVQKTVTDNLVLENERLRKQNKNLHDRLEDLEVQVDNGEQHGRNINLMMKGVPEEQRKPNSKVKENTTKKFVETINKHFDANHQLTMADIARTHRLGKFDPRRHRDKPRPIIARFVRETKKIDIYKAKKKLKQTGITLVENLTKYRANLYNDACTILGYRKVWTSEGRIFASHDSNIIQISSYEDIPGYEPVEEGDETLFSD